ncbi:hypothetical protein GUJ93_ZPchr0013g34965 [Zizania palustris]|uniref:Uncharacterized protein n=1 Tax=Zizania palustris TaxID=103762 RepID=A0A8J5X388_ZIZPA|nr:hypothetical protein GUJ93_ZPchr0013g34965 [Zizania palustris]
MPASSGKKQSRNRTDERGSAWCVHLDANADGGEGAGRLHREDRGRRGRNSERSQREEVVVTGGGGESVGGCVTGRLPTTRHEGLRQRAGAQERERFPNAHAFLPMKSGMSPSSSRCHPFFLQPPFLSSSALCALALEPSHAGTVAH